jgi:hypothetical protein
VSHPAGALHASGHQIVDGAGHPVLLRGVNRSGTEFGCAKGGGIFDGPVDDAAVNAMASWGANVVRVPLNEDCWLGINGIVPADAGANYQRAIKGWVTTLTRHGLYVILELQWGAPGTQLADNLDPMPDADHSVTFWHQVAAAYAGQSDSVIFDLFTEPWPDNNQDTQEAWRCWRDGGTCSGVPYAAAGMQTLVNTVRSTGARNLVLLGGVHYSLALTQWLAYQPTDPDSNLAASWHIYDKDGCPDTTCFQAEAGPVIGRVPLVATEVGQTQCGNTPFVDSVFAWLDPRGVGELAWTWGNWAGCESLISAYNGTPTSPYGSDIRAHLLARPG